MCKAFSGVIDKNGEVYWKLGMDSHEDIIAHFGLKDNDGDKRTVKIARFEIAPANGDYLNPDEWRFRVDEIVRPDWFDECYEKFCWDAQKAWGKKLDKILIHKPIIHPFKIAPPKKITARHLGLLKEWAGVRASVWDSVWASVWASVRASVGASVWDSVGDSVWDSVRASVRASVGDSVWASVGDSVWDSVRASVGAYISSFFDIEYRYDFTSCVKLWELGFVPSYDDTTWRLHAGKDAAIVYEISAEELRK